jgi:chemotaxis protein methyltransferase CheR
MTQALHQSDQMNMKVASDRLSDADFSRIAGLVGAHTGIKLPPGKRLMVEGRLRKRMRGLGLSNLSEYCGLLFERNGLEEEFGHVVDAVTTNKTDFFREPQHFDMLERHIVPALLKGKRGGGKPHLKLWSAASSCGAEAYTIAMVLADIAAYDNGFRFAVLGTDISTEMLSAGARAIYPAEMIAPVPADMQKRYIMHSKAPHLRGQVRIVPELRRLVRFQHLNLMHESYPVDRDVDVIFLRNVLIYFEKATQEAVVSRLIGHLRPGGYLMLGHSESMIGTNLGLRQLAPAVFQRV